MATDFEQIGEVRLRGIIDRFVDRVFSDPIIGFFFTGKDPARIREHEYTHAAASLGAVISYAGRPIAPLHRPLRINAGQFRRRLAILNQEIERAGVAADIRERWISAEQRLLPAITDGTDCV